MTETKLPYSIPEMLLHLLLITMIMSSVNSFISLHLPDAGDYESIRYYGLLIVEISIIFLLVTLQFPLKIKTLPLTLIILCTFLNMFLAAMCLHRYFMIFTFASFPPQTKFLLVFPPKFGLVALLVYLSSFMNKKLFWCIATFILASFIFISICYCKALNISE